MFDVVGATLVIVLGVAVAAFLLLAVVVFVGVLMLAAHEIADTFRHGDD